jgi:hypothetical protein
MGIQKTQKAKLSEGRGYGEGRDYIPWSKVHELGKGKSVRLFGRKSGRIHTFHSQLELYVFLNLEWDDSVIDIREQYPLFPLIETINIAKELSIRYPTYYEKYYKTIEDSIRTIDFMITKEVNGIKTDVARTVKYSSDVYKERVKQKFLIEKEYFRRRNINWGIITEKSIDIQKALNLYALYDWYTWNEYRQIPKDILNNMIYDFKFSLMQNNVSAMDVARNIESIYKLQENEGLDFLKYMLMNKIITTDLSIPLNFRRIKIYNFEDSFNNVFC